MAEDEEGNMMQNQEQESNREKASERTKEMGKKIAEKAAKKLAGKGSLMAPLAHIVMAAAPILIAIILIVGIIIFLLTMPGMVMDKLKGMFEVLGNYVAAFFGADTTEQIKETDIYATLDYLEQMGYDLKGFGFLTDYVTDLSQVSDKDYDNENGAYLDAEMGVIRNDNDNIIYAKSDYIFSYIASDNYVYTLANDNIATQEEADNWFEKLTAGIATAWYRIRNAVFGPVFDVLGATNAIGETWGKGLITLYYEDTPKNIGEKGTWVNQGSLWNWDNIKINMSNKTLSIARNEFLNSNKPIEFTLDGWSGRYGMPLEFLLSVHIATMMPDLPFDMIRNFPTRVNVYLHETSGEATAGYEIGNNQYVTYETLQNELSGLKGKNWFSAAINWFDNWFETSGEVEAARELGIDVGTGAGLCTCEFEEVEGVEIVSSACEYCKKKLEAMTKYLADSNDYNFKAYTPYIANVENHWYRDVYFVSKVDGEAKPDGFVDNDYDYEAITGERWTLYETDSNGEYILYKVNENGTYGERYNGTFKQAQEEGIAVSKKAKLVKEEDNVYEDLGWEDNGAGKWTAYAKEDTESGYERLFTDEDIEEKISGISDEIKKQAYKDALAKLYVNLNLTENVVQKGEGLRTETNPTIKKMFLQNQYLKYDGTAETAEIIAALREKGISYGALSDSDLNKSVTVKTSDGNEVTRKASEIAGKVSLNQDSLNAFSMLENTHTMDADFIYRDFKELIVELGYFEKEELTDETPRLLQWIVPDIKSAGFPNKTIDKNENEFGTMIHSKGDIDANRKNTMRAKIEELVNKSDAELGVSSEVDATEVSGINAMDTSNNSYSLRDNSQVITTLGSTTRGTMRNQLLDSIGEITEFKRDSLIETATACWDYILDNASTYSYGGASIPVSDGSTVDCSSYVSWVLYEYGFEEFKGGQHTSESFKNTNWTDLYGWEEIPVASGENPYDQLQPGDIFVRYGGDTHHVTFIVELEGGNTYGFDCGNESHWKESSKITERNGVRMFNSTYFLTESGDGKIIRIENASSRQTGQYEGYKGNEAVVSPVTGILLDYGTYDGNNDKSSVTDELYRQNVDLKYAKNTSSEDGEGEGGEQPVVNPEYDPSKPDLVGYAKILVLDAESYKKLEAHTGTEWAGNSLVYTKEETDDEGNKVIKARYKDSDKVDSQEKIEDLSEIEKTVYGYKEFAESYESGGISGYVVYIDGFECYKPDEEFTEEQLETEAPSKSDDLKITLDSFKQITTSNIEDADEDTKMDSMYKKDETHKMASKKATEKLKASASVKEQSSSTMFVDNLIFIKEGTVLGRTITDYQLIESPEYRGESGGYSKYRTLKDEETSEDEEDKDAVIGNYLRIIFRDTDDAVVENVEDYMKIDKLNGAFSSESQPYVAQPGDLELLANLLHHEGCEGFFTNILGDSKLGADASRVTGYVVINRALLNYGGYGTTIREQILAPGQYSTAYDVTSETASYCDLCLANAEWCLKYDCSSVISPTSNKPMPRNVVGQSGWCQCSSDIGKFNCWWWIDTNKDGQHTEYSGGGAFDTFYCQNTSFPEG